MVKYSVHHINPKSKTSKYVSKFLKFNLFKYIITQFEFYNIMKCTVFYDLLFLRGTEIITIPEPIKFPRGNDFIMPTRKVQINIL